eukprot:maker-scaffold_14-snap-gene-5.65-mRNA-1 protein AED:0.30 eAED:0.30 QI:153/1/1/1/1/1/2/567/287
MKNIEKQEKFYKISNCCVFLATIAYEVLQLYHPANFSLVRVEEEQTGHDNGQQLGKHFTRGLGERNASDPLPKFVLDSNPQQLLILFAASFIVLTFLFALLTPLAVCRARKIHAFFLLQCFLTVSSLASTLLIISFCSFVFHWWTNGDFCEASLSEYELSFRDRSIDLCRISAFLVFLNLIFFVSSTYFGYKILDFCKEAELPFSKLRKSNLPIAKELSQRKSRCSSFLCSETEFCFAEELSIGKIVDLHQPLQTARILRHVEVKAHPIGRLNLNDGSQEENNLTLF